VTNAITCLHPSVALSHTTGKIESPRRRIRRHGRIDHNTGMCRNDLSARQDSRRRQHDVRTPNSTERAWPHSRRWLFRSWITEFSGWSRIGFPAARLGPPHPIPHNLHPRPPVAVFYCATSAAALPDRIAPENRDSGTSQLEQPLTGKDGD
jgi:hypothetical protein